MMGIYINGIGLISPQETRDNQVFLESIIDLDSIYFPMIKPPYKEYIPARDLRRMSFVIRHGIIAAKIALAEAKVENPDAIITGTGLGCVVDTEKFLIKLHENKETLLTPTAFIQSTHNTLGGSIAIGLGCHNYNMTFVHRGLSFESTLLDAQLMMESGEIENALVGGFDEMTDNHIHLMQAMPMFSADNGAAVGQGSGFFMLEDKKCENSYAQLIALEMVYNPSKGNAIIEEKIDELKRIHELDSQNTVLLLGYNGVADEAVFYDKLAEEKFPEARVTQFKHLCGDYYTASAFAFWVAAQMLKKQFIPETLFYSKENSNKKEGVDNVLIYNRFNKNEQALILLKRC
ncbi:MAG: hypothetical protein KAH25_01860 [Bacteroidales bacterium]|nr:hypothetical protein [Bacteroidales bacterium]